MVGYLGPIHSFTYQAASTFYMQGELLPYGNFHLLFEALDKDLVEGIVVPIENSIEGTVNVVQDKLLEYGFQINREIVMDIRLSLISKSNQVVFILIFTAVGLTTAGIISAKIAASPLFNTVARIFLGGALGVIITAGIGYLLGLTGI